MSSRNQRMLWGWTGRRERWQVTLRRLERSQRERESRRGDSTGFVMANKGNSLTITPGRCCMRHFPGWWLETAEPMQCVAFRETSCQSSFMCQEVTVCAKDNLAASCHSLLYFLTAYSTLAPCQPFLQLATAFSLKLTDWQLQRLVI